MSATCVSLSVLPCSWSPVGGPSDTWSWLPVIGPLDAWCWLPWRQSGRRQPRVSSRWSSCHSTRRQFAWLQPLPWPPESLTSVTGPQHGHQRSLASVAWPQVQTPERFRIWTASRSHFGHSSWPQSSLPFLVLAPFCFWIRDVWEPSLK